MDDTILIKIANNPDELIKNIQDASEILKHCGISEDNYLGTYQIDGAIYVTVDHNDCIIESAKSRGVEYITNADFEKINLERPEAVAMVAYDDEITSAAGCNIL